MTLLALALALGLPQAAEPAPVWDGVLHPARVVESAPADSAVAEPGPEASREESPRPAAKAAQRMAPPELRPAVRVKASVHKTRKRPQTQRSQPSKASRSRRAR